MDKVSIRLSREMGKTLQSEAHRLSQSNGKVLTISDLIRGAIAEKFSSISRAPVRRNDELAELRDEIFQLKKRHEMLAEDLQKLVQTLSGMFPLLATREQVEGLTDGIAAVIRTLKGR